MENVVVVFPKLDDGNKIKAVLVKNGINVDYVCTSGAQALEYVNKLNEGIVVCSYRFYGYVLHTVKRRFAGWF